MEEKLRDHFEKIVPLTDEEFAVVLARFTSKRFKKHQFIVQEGDLVRDNYFVVSGLLKQVYTDKSDKQHVVYFAMEDWWVTDFRAYYTRTPATLSIQCLEDTVVFCLSLDNYHALNVETSPMAGFFLEKFALNTIALEQRLMSLMTTSAQERYQQLLKNYPALGQRISKNLLASYLGVSRETLSRLTVGRA